MLILAWLIAVSPLHWVAIGLVVGAGTLFLVRFSWLIWPVLALALPFASAVSFGRATLAEVLLGLAVGFWLLEGARTRRLKLAWSLPGVLFLLYAAFQLSYLPFVIDLGEALPEVLKWVEILLILLLFRESVPEAHRGYVIHALLLAGVVQGLLGVVQFVWQIGPSHFVILDRFMRASGTFAQPNPYAGYLGSLVPVALSLSVDRLARLRQRGHPSSSAIGLAAVELIWLGGATMLICAGIAVSWSRGAWLGSLVAMGVVLLLRSRKTVVSGALCLLLFATGASAGFINADRIPLPVQSRLESVLVYLGTNIEQVLDLPVDSQNFAVVERLAHWKAALLMWSERPWFGVGPGGYSVHYPQTIQQDVRLLIWEDPLGHAHNIYLHILAETGIVGLTLYLTLLVLLFTWVSLHSRNNALALGVLGVLVYLSVHNVFDNLYVRGIYLHLGLWLALVDASVRSKPDPAFGFTCKRGRPHRRIST